MKKLLIIFFVLSFTTNAHALKFINCYFVEEKDTSFDQSKFDKEKYEKYEYIFYPKQNKISQVIVRTDSYLEEKKKRWEKKREDYKKNNQGKDLGPAKHEKIKNHIYNITLYDETYIKAESFDKKKLSIGVSDKWSLVFNLKNGQIDASNDMQITGYSPIVLNNFLQCDIKKGNTKSNYLDYWWAVILIIAITFFIFTQSGKRLKKIRRK